MMQQDQYIGQQFGNYRLVQQLDCGNFGCVYRAEHLYLKNSIVAIKVLHAHLTCQQKIQGFLQQANLLAMLKHPHILPILDVGIQHGFPYMVTEQFRGLASREGDQYALGCIAYEILTGQKPFTASDMVSMMYKHVSEQPVAPRDLNPRLPTHIEQAILTAMAKE